MGLTLVQLKDLGFKPAKKQSPFAKKYDTLIYTLNSTDYLYVGYNQFKKQVNNKIIWKSFVEPDTKNRVAYQVINIGDTGYEEMKSYLERAVKNANYIPTEEELEYLNGRTD